MHTFTRRGAMLAALGLPAAVRTFGAAAKPFWDDQVPEKWSKEEIEQMLDNSPWSQKASVNFNGGPGGARGGFTYGGAVSPGDRVIYEGSGAQKNLGGKFQATVRWESSKALCDAQKRAPDGAKDFYIIGVTGDFPDLAKPDPDESPTAAEQRAEMLRGYTKLERRGDGPLYLDHLQPVKTGEWFYFPRLDPIKAAHKEITFTTKMGPLEFKAKFNLKEMLYHGKLEL